MPGGCSSFALNCSRPDTPALLEALTPVFKLNSIRPVINSSTATNVSIDFTLFGILGVDEKAQILKTFIWQNFGWKNEFISWDPEQCGSAWISVPRTLLWVPDVVINEFMDQNSAPYAPYNYLHSDGYIWDAQPVRVISSCRLDTYMFPFDLQNCTFTFNSYIYHKSAIQIELGESAETIVMNSKEVFATMGEWELVGIEAKKFELPTQHGGSYEELRFFISVKRRSTMYVVNMLIPSGFLVTIDLFSFLLPPQSVDRSLFKMTLILGYTMLMLNMNAMLPITGNCIPLINVFLSLCLGLMVVSLLETIAVTNLLRGSTNYSRLPRWIRVLVLRILGPLVGLPLKPTSPQEDMVISNPAAHVEMNSFRAAQEGSLSKDKTLVELKVLGTELQAVRRLVDKALGESQSSEEWIQAGLIIDRLLFLLYIGFLSVSFMTIIILWVRSERIT